MATLLSPVAQDATDLQRKADRLRLTILETHRHAGGGHLGSALSIVEILTVLFETQFRWPVPDADPRAGDRFVLSKGHGALALYCQLELCGRLAPASLALFGKNGSPLEPHPNERLVSAVHASSGSLGQGLSIGVGLALGSRLRGAGDRVWVLIGDGETNEGQIWEAALCAAQLGLDNLVVMLDRNSFQQDGPMSAILPVPDLTRCWGEMGWAVSSTDGHDCAALDAALRAAVTESAPAPRLLVATTTKGMGVSFLENTTESHYPPPLSADELALIRYLPTTRRCDV